jgi:hypothetical protein
VASSSKNKFFCISKNNPNILPKWSLSSIWMPATINNRDFKENGLKSF